MNLLSVRPAAVFAALFFSLSAPAVLAESGFYVGGSIGSAVLKVDVVDPDLDAFTFDEDDFGWKAYGGFVWDLPLIDLGVEGGYVDFGNPTLSQTDITYEFDTSGWSAWGVAGVDLGPLGLFGKVGLISWEVEGQTFGDVIDSFSDDGSDPAYGIGAKFMLGSFEIRGEYEYYDVDGVERLDLLSAGVVWVF
jgi:hypothetical protein